MKILLVSNAIGGGAGKACLRLFDALKLKGHEVKLLHLEGRTTANPDIVSLYPNVRDLFLRQMASFPRTVLRHMLYGDRRRQYRLPSSIHRTELHPLVEWADVINLHWVPDFVGYREFFGRVGGKPVVWTMHDMLPFAPGYHYESERPHPIPAVERRIATVKERAVKNANLSIVAPSSWLLSVSRGQKTFAGRLHRHIFNGLPLNVYQPIEKPVARRILDLPRDREIVLFTADSVGSRRKGGHILAEALRRLKGRDVLLVSVGRGRMEIDSDLDYRHLGSFADEVSMALCYCCADVVLTPSVEDNSPNIIIESLACGRPVVGFDVGGIGELINDESLGVLVRDMNGEAFAAGIERGLNGGYSADKIRADAEERFSYEALGENYTRLFEQEVAE
jgi:glycosyltransferase involved in cell wall biosynthesis